MTGWERGRSLLLLVFGAIVIAFVDAEKLRDDHVVQGAEMDHAQDGEADD